MVTWATQDHAEAADLQLVVLTQILAHELTMGYESLENLRLHTIGGTVVRNLRHAMQLIDNCEGGYLQLGLQHNFVLILKADDARRATADVLEKHGIPAAMSPDLR